MDADGPDQAAAGVPRQAVSYPRQGRSCRPGPVGRGGYPGGTAAVPHAETPRTWRRGLGAVFLGAGRLRLSRAGVRGGRRSCLRRVACFTPMRAPPKPRLSAEFCSPARAYPMTDLYAGIDLGGTTIKAAVAAPDGDILERAQAPTNSHLGPSA